MLTQFRTYYYLLFSILVLGGCVDDVAIPLPSEGDVSFSMTATLDGETFDLSAGKEGRFMFTDVVMDTNNVYLFKGTLGEVGCQYCPGSLEFEFTQVENNAILPFLEPSIISSPIQFRNSTLSVNIIGYKVDFEMELQGIAPFTMVWDFGDSNTITTTNTVVEHEYQNAGMYNVCVHVTDATGCESEICRTISTDNTMNCGINFTLHNYTGFSNTFYFNALSSGLPPFSYDWNIATDSLITTTFTNASPTVTMNQIGEQSVNVFMTDARNCNASVSQTVDFTNPNAICLQQYDYTATALTELGTLSSYFSTLTIRYIDENGLVFASDLGEPAAYSTLNVLDVEEFEVNENGQPTKKVTLEFACRLYDENGNFKDLENGLATIAVAYLF